MTNILNPDFQYTPSADTDVRKTWAKHGWKPKVKPVSAPAKVIDSAVQLILHHHFHHVVLQQQEKQAIEQKGCKQIH